MLVLGLYKSAKDGEKDEVSPKRGSRKRSLSILTSRWDIAVPPGWIQIAVSAGY